MERSPVSGIFKSEVADQICGGAPGTYTEKRGLRRTEIVISNGRPETAILLSIENESGKTPRFNFHGPVTLYQAPRR